VSTSSDRELARRFARQDDAAFAAREGFDAVIGRERATPRRRQGRWLAAGGAGVAVLAAAVAAVAVRERGPHVRATATSRAVAAPATAATGTTDVRIVAADPAAAARVPVTGATPLEEGIVRNALALLGGPSPIPAVQFKDTGTGRDLVVRDVAVGNGADAPRWLALRFVQVVVARLRDARERVGWVTDLESGQPGGPIEGMDAPPPPVETLVQAVRAATHRGVRLHADVYPIGAVVLRARLDEATFLAGDVVAHTLTAALDRFPGVALAGSIETPDGTSLGNFGHAWNVGGGGDGGRVARDAPPLRGRTRLDFTIAHSGLNGTATATRRLRLDCQTPSASSGVADVAGACTALMQRRYDLFSYGLTEHSCAPSGGDAITIRGLLGGLPVRRDDDPCYVGDVIGRIETVLGIPPGS
jgi:hypothetical protein